MCVNTYMRVYAYMFACTFMGMYLYVCGHMSMYAWGPTPCGLAAGGAVLIRVRTPNLTGTLRHPTGWLISNFLIALTGDIIFLSQCQLLRCASTSRTLMHPNLAHLLLTINQQQGRESNKLAFCSSLTTSTLVPNSITTDSYFLTLNGPASNTYAKVTQGTVTNSLYTHYNEITTNHSQMDVLPAHLNRDSFRDSLKGLVALEIILINPFGFPINKIISQPAFVENPGTPCIRSSM